MGLQVPGHKVTAAHSADVFMKLSSAAPRLLSLEKNGGVSLKSLCLSGLGFFLVSSVGLILALCFLGGRDRFRSTKSPSDCEISIEGPVLGPHGG